MGRNEVPASHSSIASSCQVFVMDSGSSYRLCSLTLPSRLWHQAVQEKLRWSVPPTPLLNNYVTLVQQLHLIFICVGVLLLEFFCIVPCVNKAIGVRAGLSCVIHEA